MKEIIFEEAVDYYFGLHPDDTVYIQIDKLEKSSPWVTAIAFEILKSHKEQICGFVLDVWSKGYTINKPKCASEGHTFLLIDDMAYSGSQMASYLDQMVDRYGYGTRAKVTAILLTNFHATRV